MLMCMRNAYAMRWKMLNGKKTQILIVHQKERLDRTKKGQLAAKKISARD